MINVVNLSEGLMEYNDSRHHNDEHKEEKYMKYPHMECPQMYSCPMYGSPMHCPMFQNQPYAPMMPGHMRGDDEDFDAARPYYSRPHYYPRPYYPRPYFYPRPFPFFFPFFW
jgi:hypothetical protein